MTYAAPDDPADQPPRHRLRVIRPGRPPRVRPALARAAVTVAGRAGAAVLALPGVAGAAAVVVGVAYEEHAGHGWAWIVGGAFGLLGGYELNRKGR